MYYKKEKIYLLLAVKLKYDDLVFRSYLRKSKMNQFYQDDVFHGK